MSRKRLEDCTDEEIDDKRFALMKKLCDTHEIEYPDSLRRYLKKKGAQQK